MFPPRCSYRRVLLGAQKKMLSPTPKEGFWPPKMLARSEFPLGESSPPMCGESLNIIKPRGFLLFAPPNLGENSSGRVFSPPRDRKDVPTSPGVSPPQQKGGPPKNPPKKREGCPPKCGNIPPCNQRPPVEKPPTGGAFFPKF